MCTKDNLKPKWPKVQYQVIIVHRIQQTHFHKGHKTTIYTLFFSVKVYLKVYLKKKSNYLENFPKSFPIACAQFMEFIKPELISKLYMWRHLILTLDNCSACCRRNKMHVTNGPKGTTKRYANAFVTAVSIHTLTDTWQIVTTLWWTNDFRQISICSLFHMNTYIHTIMMRSKIVFKVTL